MRRARNGSSGAIGIAVVVLGLLIGGCSSSPPAAAYTSPSDPDAGLLIDTAIDYRDVDGRTLKLDSCRPQAPTAPTPAVLLVHGGGFSEGSRDSGGMGDMCRELARSGLAAFSIDYRLVPENHFPAQTDDAAAAIEWLRRPENAQRFGIDPTRLGVLGSSAGAIIAQYLGTNGSGPTDSGTRVKAVASFSGASDLTAGSLRYGKPSPEAIATILGYLGCDSVDESECPIGSEASPITHVDAGDAAMILLASDDEIVPVGQTTAMQEALAAAGVPNQVIIEPGSKHGMQLNTADNRSAVIAFLTEHL